MSQSNIIIGAILFGFFVYITVKGELPAYLALFFGTSNTNAPGPVTQGGSYSAGS